MKDLCKEMVAPHGIAASGESREALITSSLAEGVLEEYYVGMVKVFLYMSECVYVLTDR